MNGTWNMPGLQSSVLRTRESHIYFTWTSMIPSHATHESSHEESTRNSSYVLLFTGSRVNHKVVFKDSILQAH